MTLRTRTALFAAAAIMISVCLILAVTWRKLDRASLDVDRQYFSSIVSGEEEVLNTAFAELLADRVGVLTMRRDALRETALRARETLRALDAHLPADAGREAIRRRVLADSASVARPGADDQETDPIVQAVLKAADLEAGLLPIPGLTLDSRAVMGRSMRHFLETLDPDGGFCLFRLPGSPEDGDVGRVLIHFLPMDGRKHDGLPAELVMTYFRLDRLAAAEKRAEAELIGRMRDKFENLDVYRRSVMAILDDTGDVLVRAGSGPLPPGLPALLEASRRRDGAGGIISDDDGTLCHVAFNRAFSWHILLAAPMSDIHAPAREILIHILGLSLLLAVILAAVAPFLVHRSLKPLSQLAANARRLAETDFSSADALDRMEPILARGLHPERDDELGRLSAALIHMGDALGTSMRRLLETAAVRTRMEGELAAAASIQMGMLPPPADVERICGFPAAAFLSPAKEVGGDLYDVFALPGGRRAIVLGDVSDKGVPAALFMAMAVTLARSSLVSGMDPARAMEHINAFLEEHNPGGMFVTLFLGILDPAAGELIHANGGHCPPLVIPARPGAPMRRIEAMGGPLVGALPGAAYESHTDRLEEDEICLIFTDGVTEAMNADGELYGEDRLLELAAAHAADSPADLVAAVSAALARHRGDAPQSDDITMLAFRRA